MNDVNFTTPERRVVLFFVGQSDEATADEVTQAYWFVAADVKDLS